MQSKIEQIKARIRAIGGWYFPKFASNYMFRERFGRNINFKNPEFLDDKLMCLKFGLYKNNQQIADLADKIRVRDYVKKCGLSDILVPEIAEYKSANEIVWDELPEQFVLKCNHGCGYNIIVDEKDKFSESEVKEKLNLWMSKKFGGYTGEIHYRLIKPGIICEEFIHGLGNMEEGKSSLPVDYKFFCLNGRVECILVVAGREKGEEKTQRFFTDRHFELLDICGEKMQEGFDYQLLKPSCLVEMVETAEKLSRPFPFVRVDLYNNNGKILFGEMTFTPMGCVNGYITNKGQKWLGDKLVI
ncbi:MAG: hypothetical protein HDR06_05325 [Lachnospiraceae bacterium]|nr:hypothetical protein [Lachnospiraceae bacterium]